MIYPSDFETKTGFDRIRQMLYDKCMSSLGAAQVEQIAFSADHALIRKWLHQTEEFRQILLLGEPFPQSNYYNPTDDFRHIRPEGTFLEPEVLLDLRLSMETIGGVIRFLSQKLDTDTLKYPWLAQLTAELAFDDSLPVMIGRIIDEKAQVRNQASPELARIRKEQISLESQASRKINQLLGQAKSQGLVASDMELALRNGRLVIPVPASEKRKIKGFVHDHSSTGQTVFLEPEEVFEINNHLRELELDERREVIRVLKRVTDQLRPHVPELLEAYQMLGTMDAIRAKAKLALQLEALMPQLNDRPGMQWVNARHPLLYLSHKAQGKPVEPLTISLDGTGRILVISGPNAGGKSVVLKTCGLLQYMLQCGLLVPMEDYSEVGVFQQLFIDIGDQQSIENDLSTYSSHLLNMRHFATQANGGTLFLIDEFGAGTEPRIGGAIAEAILEQLHQTGAQGVITTHYANLKLMAGRFEGILNGSMLFDTSNMRPLFRLKTGNPGSSFAFEIARTIGLPPAVLARAEEVAGSQELDFDRQLQDLDLKKNELEEKEKQLRSAEAFLSEMIDKYETLSRELETRKGEILIKARQEAKSMLEGTNRMIENTIRQIKESQAQKEKTRQAREQLNEFTKTQQQALEGATAPVKKAKAPKPEKDNTPIGVGDAVRVEGQQTIGEVLETSGKQALVSFGSIKFKTRLDKLEKIKKSSLPKAVPTKGKTRLTFDINEKAAEFSPQIDLRGKRAEDALMLLSRLVDDAILLGIRQLRIVHGKGDGILRNLVRDYLSGVPQVKHFQDEHADRGGAGITLAELK
ncbi:MAG: Smr/MutS family protein [Bacteroidales bacterium]